MGVATLYALPGVEADVSFGRWDARVQMAGGSPSNADGFRYLGIDRLQWVAGGGYSIHQGFRVGGSASRGPYLGGSAPAYLPAGKTIRDYPNTDMGLDIQWARGRLSASGEMQRFVFSSPNFVQSPNWLFTYGETKIIVTPRLFIAGRSGNLHAGAVRDVTGISSAQFAPGIVSTEAAVGLWLGPRVLLKTGYE